MYLLPVINLKCGHLCWILPPFLKRPNHGTNLCMVPVPHTKQHDSLSSWLTCLTLCGFARFFNLVFGQLFSFLFGFWHTTTGRYTYMPRTYTVRTLIANCHDELTNGGQACALRTVLALPPPPPPPTHISKITK
jgi:hypothetical protein